MCREWERGEVLSRFWWGILRKRDPLKYLYLEYNIKIDLKEIGFEDIVLIDLVQGKWQVVGSCKRDNDPPGSIKSSDFFD